MKKYLVYDIGGTYIKFAVMNEGKIFLKGQTRTPKTSLEDFLDALEKIAKPHLNDITGIAISMPGIIDSEKGHAVHGGSLLYIQELNLKAILEKRFNRPVSIENDGKSAALGEMWKGKLQGIENGIALVLGTGVGGGMVINGQLYKGSHFSAGEFSAIRGDALAPFDLGSLLGLRGSSTELVKSVAQELNLDEDEFNGQAMFDLIRSGCQEAQSLFDNYCELIVGQILNLQAIIDPEVIVIGGGMSAEPMLVSNLKKVLDQHYETDSILKMFKIKPNILASHLGNTANLYGALYRHLKESSLVTVD